VVSNAVETHLHESHEVEGRRDLVGRMVDGDWKMLNVIGRNECHHRNRKFAGRGLDGMGWDGMGWDRKGWVRMQRLVVECRTEMVRCVAGDLLNHVVCCVR
jgi:hypothetical protein